LRVWQRVKINERRSHIIETVGYTIFTWLILASGLWLLDGSLNESIIKMVFIGLAALTVPHMILVDFWANRRKVL
ncbi:MAG: Brp/Blh family beta-carotene 15,15'-dioxygenase, partial [Pseudomonadota bacterium]|nr:Brp/Blh family beta-carotene 15,15'-dioxygenase [Pseudomonadota bacterium]